MKKFLILFFVSFLFANFNDFHKKFIINDSYTIDPYNNKRVTSEAQGYTLYLCVIYNKPGLFKSIWSWTKKNMQRKDYLFSWKYNYNKIRDKNNAADGDFFIAYSLLLAYKKWGNKVYFDEFQKIFKSVTKLFLPVLWNNSLDILLFPAKYGFLKNNILTIFPSYYIPFIFKQFSLYKNIYKSVYKYTYTLFNTTNLTTNINYDLINKNFYSGPYMSLDVYRIIWYSYLDNYDVSKFQNTFKMANEFFKKKGFLPLNLYINGKYEKKSPYCVYKWFYLVYNNKKYLQKYMELKKVDKKNYFCEALDLMKDRK